MASKGLEQLLSLQSSLNSLIDAYARAPGASSLCALDEVGKEVSLEPVDPRLAKISATLNNMSAVVLGDKLPFQRAFEYHIITALHVAYDAHVEETLREARERGSTAVAVETLAKPTGIEPQKLARCLRLLAAYHIFAESEPDEFSPNRCSASLDSGLAIEEILRDPLAKYSSSKGGLGAMVGHFAEEGLRAASFTSEALLHPSKPRDYGFSRAYDRDKIWDYFGREANEAKRKRFQCGFGALSKCFDREESILRGFPWRDIPEGSIVCDVAGRTGNVSLEIASANPHLRFVVQDQEKVIEQMAVPFWETPGAKPYKDRVELIAHDFFDPQPVEGAAVYLIRLALHGFAEDQVVKILTNVAAAASPSSRLVIVEAAYESLAAPGAYPAQSTIPYLLDLQMLTMINVTERLEQQYKRLALEAGWKLAKTWKTGSDGLTDGTFRHYEFVLAAC